MNAYPPDLTTVTIRFGPYLDVAGNIATRQAFIVSPPAPVIHTPTGTVLIPTRVRVETGADGTAEVVVPATDDPNITPQDFTYRIEPPPWMGEPLDVPAPASVPVIDYDLLQPFPPSDGEPVPTVWPWESAQAAQQAATAAELNAARAEVFAANTVELQDTAFTALIADPESGTRAQLSATMGVYLDDNVPVEVSGALASDPVVQAGVDAAIDVGLPPAIATVLPGAVTTEVGSQVAPFVTAAAGSATAAQTAQTGAEAARDLALAGQFAGASLGTANLNTILTAGVYFQTTTGNATLAMNYPRESALGTLTVTRTGSSTTVQEYRPTTGLLAKGVYIRRHVTSSGLWTAWSFIPTQRVDQTAGRAIYTWDDVNNREQLIYGDTGWRELTLENGWAGSVRARRIGSTVDVVCTTLVAGSSTLITPLGSGFRPQQNIPIMARPANIANPPFYGQVTWQTGYLSLPTAQLYGNQSSQFSFTTLDPWPTTLPGTPVGSIPA